MNTKTRVYVETALRDRASQRTIGNNINNTFQIIFYIGTTNDGQINWHIKPNEEDKIFLENPVKIVNGDLR